MQCHAKLDKVGLLGCICDPKSKEDGQAWLLCAHVRGVSTRYDLRHMAYCRGLDSVDMVLRKHAYRVTPLLMC